MMATGQHASMISLVVSSACVIDVMAEKRRHLGEAKKATTASEMVRQPRKVVRCAFCRNVTNATPPISHGKHSGRGRRGRRTED